MTKKLIQPKIARKSDKKADAHGNGKPNNAHRENGDNLWRMDMIAPFGGQEEAMKELREKVFAGRKIKTLQPAPSGEGMVVVEW
ncbi:toxin-activating lysine-acyltransferase [Thalassospiraceae bacterium LMO-JJ14]|nr:toxin-activating lysine-acyltransferase [Thalassospiraceae bacterium LMO-JJ14]